MSDKPKTRPLRGRGIDKHTVVTEKSGFVSEGRTFTAKPKFRPKELKL